MMQDTSTRAYNTEVRPQLGHKQAAVRRLLLAYPQGLTNAEISNLLQIPVNTVTPRIFELRKLGVAMDAGKRECRATGRTAHAWKLTYQPKVAPIQTQQKLAWNTPSN